MTLKKFTRDITKDANGRYPEAALSSNGARPDSEPFYNHNLAYRMNLIERNPVASELLSTLRKTGDNNCNDLKAELNYIYETDWRKIEMEQRRNNQNPADRETPEGGIGR